MKALDVPIESDLRRLRGEVKRAGHLCLEIRASRSLNQETKSDLSPVTEADLVANEVIESCLKSLEFRAPIISEEAANAVSDLGATYWLVDPLDGTKDFISGSKGFTQNVCLVRNGNPVFGIVYAPAFEFMAWTGENGLETSGSISIAEEESKGAAAEEVIVASKSHLDSSTEAFLDRFPESRTVQIGSSLKILLLAIGVADIYPRFAPTMPWDIAAADACLRAAGGGLFNAHGELLEYSKPLEKNSAFLGLSSSMIHRRIPLLSVMNEVCF